MIIRHAPMTDQPTIQPTMTEIIAQVGIGGMPRAPRPPPAHKTPADPGLDGDHREGVGHDVVQLASDADPLFADLLAGEFGLGGALPLRLLGQSGLVPPMRGNCGPR